MYTKNIVTIHHFSLYCRFVKGLTLLDKVVNYYFV